MWPDFFSTKLNNWRNNLQNWWYYNSGCFTSGMALGSRNFMYLLQRFLFLEDVSFQESETKKNGFTKQLGAQFHSSTQNSALLLKGVKDQWLLVTSKHNFHKTEVTSFPSVECANNRLNIKLKRQPEFRHLLVISKFQEINFTKNNILLFYQSKRCYINDQYTKVNYPMCFSPLPYIQSTFWETICPFLKQNKIYNPCSMKADSENVTIAFAILHLNQKEENNHSVQFLCRHPANIIPAKLKLTQR